MKSVLLGIAVSCAVLPALAQEGPPTTPPAIEKRLSAYDPRAVAAARHYYMQPAVKAGLVAVVDNMDKAMTGLVAQQNPSLSPQQQDKIRQIVGDVTKERFNLILEMSMISALDTFSTDELVALDTFYSSPMGASILSKMPQLSRRLPAMMQAIMPGYMNEVKEKVRQNGAELKL